MAKNLETETSIRSDMITIISSRWIVPQESFSTVRCKVEQKITSKSGEFIEIYVNANESAPARILENINESFWVFENSFEPKIQTQLWYFNRCSLTRKYSSLVI